MKDVDQRTRCIVPHCRRTRRASVEESRAKEWICAKHWRLADTKRRRSYNKLVRRALKWMSSEGIGRREDRLHSLCRTLDGAWCRLKHQVIERAMGIRA